MPDQHATPDRLEPPIRANVTTLDVQRLRNHCAVCGRTLAPGEVVMYDVAEMACIGRGCYREWERTRS